MSSHVYAQIRSCYPFVVKEVVPFVLTEYKRRGLPLSGVCLLWEGNPRIHTCTLGANKVVSFPCLRNRQPWMAFQISRLFCSVLKKIHQHHPEIIVQHKHKLWRNRFWSVWVDKAKRVIKCQGGAFVSWKELWNGYENMVLHVTNVVPDLFPEQPWRRSRLQTWWKWPSDDGQLMHAVSMINILVLKGCILHVYQVYEQYKLFLHIGITLKGKNLCKI